MAKVRATAPAVRWDHKRFSGQSFVLAGQFRRWDRELVEALIRSEGGVLVDEVTPTTNFVIEGKVAGKSTQARKKAEKLNQEGQANIQLLSQATFMDRTMPEPALAEALLRAGEQGKERWNLLRRSRAKLDLKGLDLKGLDLRGFWLWQLELADCDLRECNLEEGWGLNAPQSRLDEAHLARCNVGILSDARLRKADLSGARVNKANLDRADCTGSNLSKAYGEAMSGVKAVFARANLSRALLGSAKLTEADLSGADLTKTDLHEANLEKAVLKRAVLRGADLSSAVLTGADLSRADLRDAILVGADLTGANLEGADFTGANLTGTKMKGAQASKARGLAQAGPVKAGPLLQELDAYAAQAGRIRVELRVRLPDEAVAITVSSERKGQKNTYTTPKLRWWGSKASLPSASAALLEAIQPYRHGKLELASIKAKADGGPFGGKKLQRLALSACCEAFGLPVPSEEELAATVEEDRAGQEKQREAVLARLRSGADGVAWWNALSGSERLSAGPYEGIDLSGASLEDINLSGQVFPRANFEKAALAGAILQSCDLPQANFRGADLARANLNIASLQGADLTGANLSQTKLRAAKMRGATLKDSDLTEADLSYAKLQAADLTGAKLEGARWSSAEFDEATVWPKGFTVPRDLLWRGKAVDPRRAQPPAVVAPAAPAPALTLPQFMEKLRGVVELGRLNNAVRMLKSERFQLFSKVEDDKLVGVIRSQSSDERVYACKLSADGSFSCGTQNLRVCGGLGGEVCKHLLVLIVGLAKSGQVDPGRTYQWVANSKKHRPFFDKDEASAVFLRYKGAEAGEIDWRPTETIPEDYYAL